MRKLIGTAWGLIEVQKVYSRNRTNVMCPRLHELQEFACEKQSLCQLSPDITMHLSLEAPAVYMQLDI